MVNSKALDDLRDRAVVLVRHALASTRDERAETLRELAGVLADAREHFHLKDGSPDIQGRSWDYKQWAHEMYGAANVPTEARQKLYANIAYHVSGVVHERFGRDDIAGAGLSPKSARDRRADRRLEEMRLLSLFGGGGPITHEETVTEALVAMQSSLKRMAPEVAPRGVVRAVESALKQRKVPDIND